MQSAETVLGVLHERGRRGLRDMPPGHPCRTGHNHHPEMNTGERYASKGARTVRGGADGKGKGPEPRAPRRAAYFTLWEPGGEIPPGYPTVITRIRHAHTMARTNTVWASSRSPQHFTCAPEGIESLTF